MIAKNLKEWRQLVLDRDNHTCQKCGNPGNIADHIESSLDTKLLLETNNGRALCISCHGKHGDRISARNLEKRAVRKAASDGGYEISLPPDIIRSWLDGTGNRVVQVLYMGLPFIVIAPLEMSINRDILELAVKVIEEKKI